MSNKLITEKVNLIDETFEELNKNCPRGMYIQMEEHFPELEERFNESEEKINQLVNNGTITEIKKALEGFWYLHQELLNSITHLQSREEVEIAARRSCLSSANSNLLPVLINPN